MNVFHYLDVAIGFSMVMAVLSAVAGAFGQTWMAAFRTRAARLEKGLSELFSDFGAKPLELASAVLGHGNTGMWRRAGDADNLSREDAVIGLLRQAVKSSEDVLVKKLAALGISNPAQTLQEVELAILEQEKAHPELAAQVWKMKALAEKVPKLAAPIFAQFDDVLDRASDDSTFIGRVVSCVAAAVFLFGFYPVDSIALLSRLAQNDVLAKSIADRAADLAKDPNQTAVLDKLVSENLFGPLSPGCQNLTRPGVWVTWVLVSLGAPFWLGVLDKALGFRSQLAKKVEDQKTVREMAQPPPPPPKAAPPDRP